MDRLEADCRSSIPTVLAPGLLCDERLWNELRPQLIGPTLGVDFREDATLDAMADRILSVAPRRFVLVGFSMGGMAAILAACKAPHRISGLVVLSTHGVEDDEGRRLARQTQIKRADDEPFDALIASLPGLYFSDPGAHEGAATLIEAMAADQGADVFKRHIQALIDRPDIGSAARGLGAPAAFLSGAEDRIAPAVLGSRLALSVPRANFICIPKCGHMAPLERPDVIAPIINAYVRAAQKETAL